MPEVPKPEDGQSLEPPSAEVQDREHELEREVGEFITRNVLEKDTVFFEG
jgi:hypothetical protein